MLKQFFKLVLLCIPFVCNAYDGVWGGSKLTDDNVPIMLYNIPPAIEGKNYGTVIVAHGCYGISPHEERIGAMFSREGFNAVLVDSWKYRNVPKGTVCQTYSVSGQQRLEEVYKTVNWIKQQKWHKGDIFLIGFSHGGIVALAASKNGPEKGIAKAEAFYPYCWPSDHTEPKIPVQLHIGSSDTWTPPHRCRGIFKSWFKEYKYGEYFEYPDTHHSFDAEGVNRIIQGLGENGITTGRIIRYNPESTRQAYERVLKFFKE